MPQVANSENPIPNIPQQTPLGTVAAPHYLATQVGAEILREGGNAFDAAVSVSLAIGVVQPYSSGIGGGCSITYYTADGASGSIGARGPAPKGLDRAQFFDSSGAPNYDLVQAGGLASVVPSLVAALRTLHERRGRLSWARVCLAPQSLAQEGFAADFKLARTTHLASSVQKLSRFAQNTPLAEPILEGQRVVQPGMAATLAALARDPDVLYTGDLGQRLVNHVQRIGGVLAQSDLAEYRPQVGDVQQCTYRGWRILAPALPTIGALQVLLVLQILDRFELSRYVPGSVEHLHLVAEAIKLSYRARANLETEADAATLADPERAAQMAALIRPERVLPFQPAAANDVGSSTSHFCVADAAGNVVSQTQTVRSGFGSGVVEPHSGIVLNDTVGDFSLLAGDVTTQGISYRGNYNLAQPGAEPASSQSPIIALHPASGAVLAVGAAGGPTIVSATVQALINCIDFGMDARASAGAPRVHCHGPTTQVEAGVAVAAQLEALGHRIERVPPIATMQIIRRCGDGMSDWEGAADPRGPGAAAVVVRNDATTAIRMNGYQSV